MSRFSTIEEPDPSSPLATLYGDIVRNGFGVDKPINWFTSQSERPDILQATWSLTQGILVDGELPGTLKQMIAMVVSEQNNCRYCSQVHTGALEAMGVPSDVIQACVADPELADIPLPHRQVLKFALKAARDPNSIDQDDFETLRSNQLSDSEILEVAMMAAFTNFINTWADVAGVVLDGNEA